MKDRSGAKKLYKANKTWIAAGLAAATLFSVSALGGTTVQAAGEQPTTSAQTTTQPTTPVSNSQGISAEAKQSLQLALDNLTAIGFDQKDVKSQLQFDRAKAMLTPNAQGVLGNGTTTNGGYVYKDGTVSKAQPDGSFSTPVQLTNKDYTDQVANVQRAMVRQFVTNGAVPSSVAAYVAANQDAFKTAAANSGLQSSSYIKGFTVVKDIAAAANNAARQTAAHLQNVADAHTAGVAAANNAARVAAQATRQNNGVAQGNAARAAANNAARVAAQATRQNNGVAQGNNARQTAAHLQNVADAHTAGVAAANNAARVAAQATRQNNGVAQGNNARQTAAHLQNVADAHNAGIAAANNAARVAAQATRQNNGVAQGNNARQTAAHLQNVADAHNAGIAAANNAARVAAQATRQNNGVAQGNNARQTAAHLQNVADAHNAGVAAANNAGRLAAQAARAAGAAAQRDAYIASHTKTAVGEAVSTTPEALAKAGYDKNGYAVKPVTTKDVATPAPVATKPTAAKTLPKTGDNNNVVAAGVGAVAVLGALFGLAGDRRKRA